MLEYDRIDISEGVDVNKNMLTSKKCYLCGYWYFIYKHMCNGCHDMSIKTISLHNLCIGYNNGNAYRINFAFMSKNDALNLIKNTVIIDKKGTL